jgi:hypothetical protein
MKEMELQYYKKFVGFLTHYEEGEQKANEVIPNQGGIESFKIVTSQDGTIMKDRIDKLGEELNNSFKHIRNWIKMEMMNLETLILAIHEKERCYERKHKAVKALTEQQKQLKRIDEGKFTFKTMLKSKSSKDQYKLELLQSIQQKEKDISNWDEIKKYITIYIIEKAVPLFKERKALGYHEAINLFSVDEIGNANNNLRCWTEFKKMTD